MHTDYDGDTLFALSAGSRPVVNFALLQAAAVKAVERAVIDAVSGSVATEAGFELSDEE